MQSPSRTLFVLHEDSQLRGWLMETAGKLYRVVSVLSWAELRDRVRCCSPSTIAVVDPYAEGRGGALSSELAVLIRDFPSLPVIAAFDVTPSRANDLRTLAIWGIAEVILHGEETAGRLMGILQATHRRTLQRLLDRALPHPVPSRAQVLLEVATEVAATGGGSPELAAALDVSERTMQRWCIKTALPPPRRLLSWLRILRAAELLDEQERSVAAVAHCCGYSLDNALRRAFQNLLGLTVAELRAKGVFAVTAQAFAQELTALRKRQMEAGPSSAVWLI